jgi:hypothetical protein
MLYMSESIKLPTQVTPKTDFALSREQYMKCARDSRSHVNFFVIESIRNNMGMVIQDRAKNREALRARIIMGLNMGLNVLEKVIRMHTELEMVHGNISPSSIVELVDGSFGLIGFRKAFIVQSLPLFRRGNVLSTLSCFGFPVLKDQNRPGFVDDVYMTLLTMASVMSNGAVYDHCMSLEGSESKLTKFHRESFIFDPTEDFLIDDAFSDLSDESRNYVYDCLWNMITYVRSVSDLDFKLEFSVFEDNIIAALQILLENN